MTSESLVAWKAARAERNRKLDRATQALKDAAVHMAVVKANPNSAREAINGAEWLLTVAAEDYADAYLRAK